MSTIEKCFNWCSGSSSNKQFSYDVTGTGCYCYDFTGSNVADDGCYINSSGLSEMCSYEMSSYLTINPLTCLYSTGTSCPPPPDASLSCGAGAKWGRPQKDLKSSSSSVITKAECYTACSSSAQFSF